MVSFTETPLKCFSTKDLAENPSADADSGCSRGTFNALASFVHLETLQHPVWIVVADGSMMSATQGGIVHIYVEYESKWNLIVLEDQLLVPSAHSNLIPIGRLTMYMYKAVFDGGYMTIYKADD